MVSCAWAAVDDREKDGRCFVCVKVGCVWNQSLAIPNALHTGCTTGRNLKTQASYLTGKAAQHQQGSNGEASHGSDFDGDGVGCVSRKLQGGWMHELSAKDGVAVGGRGRLFETGQCAWKRVSRETVALALG